MKYAAFGLLVFAVTLALVVGGYSVGYNDAKRDVAENYWDQCRVHWNGNPEWRTFCSEDLETELGVSNTWGFK